MILTPFKIPTKFGVISKCKDCKHSLLLGNGTRLCKLFKKNDKFVTADISRNNISMCGKNGKYHVPYVPLVTFLDIDEWF